MKSWLQHNNIEIYSINHKVKSVVAESVTRILMSRFYKYMTLVSKNVCIDKLDDIVNKYNNTYHRTIKMKPVDVKDNTYIDFGKENNNKDSKFKIDDHVKIPKYENIFAKGYTSSQSEEVFVIKKVKNTFPWLYVKNDINGEKVSGMKKNCKKTNQNKCRVEKIIKFF